MERIHESKMNQNEWHNRLALGRPFLVSGLVEKFPAVSKWTEPYLAGVQVDGDVTLTTRKRVDDEERVPWSKAVSAVFRPRKDAAEGSLYLQQTHTPSGLADDILIPHFFPSNTEWAEGLINVWISQAGPDGSTTVPHYDPLDNLLCVLTGSKHIRLYAPRDLPDIFAAKKFDPRSRAAFVPTAADEKARKQVYANLPYVSETFDPSSMKPFWEGTVSAGEALCIPAYWVHCVTSAPGLCIAVNYWVRTALGFSGDVERSEDAVLASISKYLFSAPTPQTLSMRYTKIEMELAKARQQHKQLDPLFHK